MRIVNSSRVRQPTAFIRLILFCILVAPSTLPAADRSGANDLLADFAEGLDSGLNRQLLPSTYQPIPGLTISYKNVGLFNEGPDHTSGASGGNRYCTYQLQYTQPQVFTFSKPVSIPSLWLTTFGGGGEPVVISLYSDPAGSNLLGTILFSTPKHPAGGSYVWSQCTNLDHASYNGLIRRMDLSAGAPNANLDDMTLVVNTNIGPLASIRLTLPETTLFRGMSRQANVRADYQSLTDVDESLVQSVHYQSSAPDVATITPRGLVHAISAGKTTLTAEMHSKSSRIEVTVLPVPGTLVDFNSMDNLGNRVPIPPQYQPVPGLRISYSGVGLFSGGPDHTTDLEGNSRYSTFQFENGAPQTFSFNKPVSIPSLWLATFRGDGDQVAVSAFEDPEGHLLIGKVFFNTARFPGPGNYVWMQCTNLHNLNFNGRIRRLEVADISGNAQLDDMALVVNSDMGELQQIRLALPTTNLFPGMSRQATLSANYSNCMDSDVTTCPGVVYKSSSTEVVTVTSQGLVQAVSAGTATVSARLLDQIHSVTVAVWPGAGKLVDFNRALENLGNYIPVPSSYQPIEGLTIGYSGVALFNGGPDHTAGILRQNHYSTYQLQDASPQVFTFSEPVSLPSLWLATYYGTGDQVIISAYADPKAENLLGKIFFKTAAFAGPGNYVWVQCTNLGSAVYNGRIRRVEIQGVGANAQVDDISVIIGSHR